MLGENARKKGDGFIKYLSSVLPTSEEFESLIIARPQFGLWIEIYVVSCTGL